MSKVHPRFAPKAKKRKKPRCGAVPCERIFYTEFANGSWCFGLRKVKRSRPCDVVAHCELDRNGYRLGGWNMTVDEAALICAGLSQVIAAAMFDDHYKCARRQCTEWVRCGNGGKRQRSQ